MEELQPSRERFKLSVSVFVIFRNEDKILFIKRSNTGWMDGYFSLPAGKMDEHESPAKAAVREVVEEIGVDTKSDNLQLVHTMYNLTHGQEWIGMYFLCHAWEGEATIKEPRKHSELRWEPITKMPENTIPYVRQAIENWAQNITYSEYSLPLK